MDTEDQFTNMMVSQLKHYLHERDIVVSQKHRSGQSLVNQTVNDAQLFLLTCRRWQDRIPGTGELL